MNIDVEQISLILLHQLRNYWLDVDEKKICDAVPDAIGILRENYRGIPNKRLWDKELVFSPYMSVQWMNFLYRVCHVIYKNGGGVTADQVYYLNKIMHSIDWFYAIDLPVHFHCEHPLGSVLGRANYGDYFFIYQGTTVGGNRKNGKLQYPVIGDNVILYANATVLGNTHIGNNVVVAADTFLMDEIIPDNCLVFGHSPNIIVKNKSEIEIKEYTEHIWGWRTR